MRLSELVDGLLETTLVWLLGGDATYAVLPLGIMWLVHVSFPERNEDFFLLKEWSFASIIFFGVAIQKFVRLKEDIQKDRSFRRSVGIQFYVVLLILTALLLTCVLLAERSIIPTAIHPLLAKAQVTLFCFGAVSMYISVLAETKPGALSRRHNGSYHSCLFRLGESLEHAKQTLDEAKYWARRGHSAKREPASDPIKERGELEADLERLANVVSSIERRLSETKTELHNLPASVLHKTEPELPGN